MVCCDRLLQCIIVFGFVWYEPLKYDDYVYPGWANAIGWGMAFSSILCMPILAIGAFFMSSGSVSQVSCPLLFLCFTLISLCSPVHSYCTKLRVDRSTGFRLAGA
jgi:hypothetical protein